MSEEDFCPSCGTTLAGVVCDRCGWPRFESLRADLDEAYKTIARLNRRAQQAERMVGVAMRAGRDQTSRLQIAYDRAMARNSRLEDFRQDVYAVTMSIPYRIACFLLDRRVR